MNFLNAIVWAAIGCFAGLALATNLGPAFGHPFKEGDAAYFGLLTGAPLGLIVGALFGYKISRAFGENAKGRSGFFVMTLIGVAAFVGVNMAHEAKQTEDHLNKGGGTQSLTSYIRLPPGVAAPDKSVKVVFELRSDKETRKNSPYDEPNWEMKDGRATMQGSVDVYRATTDRSMAVTIGNGPTYIFKLNIPARPPRYSYEGPWQKPDAVEGAGGVEGLELRAVM